MMEGTGRWTEMRLEAVNARLRGQGFMLRAVGSHAGSETARRNKTRRAAGGDCAGQCRSREGRIKKAVGVIGWLGGQWAGLEGVGSPERLDEGPNGL